MRPRSRYWLTRQLSWALPGSLMLLLPKCPACCVVYLMLLTGSSVSFATAKLVLWSVNGLCLGLLAIALSHGIALWLSRMREKGQW